MLMTKREAVNSGQIVIYWSGAGRRMQSTFIPAECARALPALT